MGAPANSVEQELLEEFANQGPRVPVAVVLAALLIVAMAWHTAPASLCLGWLTTVVLVLCIRHGVHSWAVHAQHLALRRRMAAVVAVSLLGGTVHGASILFWPFLSDLERAVQSTYVLALCSGAVAAVIGYMPVFIAYMLPLFVPLVASWLHALAGTQGLWRSGSALVMLLLFGIYAGLLVVLARDTFRHYRESFDSRRKLRDALEVAETANRAKTRFLASASHDLRQPMHTLTLFGAALALMKLPDRAQHVVAQMNLALQALNSQLDALLDISKLDAGVITVCPQPVALNDALHRLAGEFEPLAQRKGLSLSLDCPGPVTVLADPILLDRVLRNLVDNAIKYTAQGWVTVKVRNAPPPWVTVVIEDSGIGIPSEERERVFDEFYQIGNPERDRSQGLGLGLAIVRRLVSLMGVRLELQSATGQGTMVSLTLPLASQPVTLSPPDIAPAISLAGLRLLVLDDEEQVRQGMRVVLESLGCEVITAASIDEAWTATADWPVDAVLADLRLRGQDSGVAAVQRLRGRWPTLPAVLVSGDTAPERLREADAAGLRLLHKPVQVHVLARSIRDLVDGAAAPGSPQQLQNW